MKKLCLLAVWVMCVANCFAREGVEWLSTTYDFGTFKEVDGPQTGFVRLVNHGPEETVINRVKSTCGCTVAEYTEGVIAPGDTAEVRFTYNPAGRPGRFSKSIKVYMGLNDERTSVSIKGMVIGKPESLTRQYPIECGPLRLSATSLVLGDVIKGTSRHEFIYGYNQSNDTIYPSWENVPHCLSLGVSSKSIEPGDMVTISIYYNTRDDDNLGLSVNAFDLIADKNNPEIRVPVEVTANVKVDTSHLSAEDIKNAPCIALDTKVVDLGTVNGNSRIKGRFVVKNEGVNTLHVNRIYSFNKAFSVKRMPTKLKSGKSERVEFELDFDKIPEGVFNIKADVVSNDPLRPSQTVRIVGVKK